MMAAMTAGQRGRRVLLLDHGAGPGAKILISGGGRCNFTNREAPATRFLSANPHFAKSALSRYRPADFIALLDRHGIAWHEKTLGQLFCDGSARQVVAMLVAECQAAGVDMRLAHGVTDLRQDGRFHIVTDHGTFSTASLVVATGGLSIPKLGATGFAYEVAKQFGVPVVPPAPALVPLTFADPVLDMMRALSGTACDVVATVGRTAFREAMLFTHRGLSGPAILQVSSYLAADDGVNHRSAARTGCARVLVGAQAGAAEDRAAHGARGVSAAASGAGPGAGGGCSADRRPAGPRAGGDGRASQALAADAIRHRGLREG